MRLDPTVAAGFDRMWTHLLGVGRDPAGGYSRFAWSEVDLALREWFATEAAGRGLRYESDRNGNQWAWWGEPGSDAVVTGSHLDSVPGGGAYDGPLGVVSAFAAVDALRADGVRPGRPIAVVRFSDEEGGRFGVSCVGSRLTTGDLAADRARALTDVDGTTLAEAMRAGGADPDGLGRDEVALSRIGCFVELHVEQGRGLADLGAPVAVASAVWPHGRWRLTVTGEGNHAGTTRLVDRRDPMLTVAETVLSARKRARLAEAVATLGRIEVTPNATNTVPSVVRAWLDARAPDETTLTSLVDDIRQRARLRAGRDGTTVEFGQESWTPRVDFPERPRDRIRAALAADFGDVPVLSTAAGHDAGILATDVPTAMLFVRNPTGVSHSPAEFAERDDGLAGVQALATVLADLAG